MEVKHLNQKFIRFRSIRKSCKYKKTSLAVQKQNYAVRMYKNVGFEIVDENAEEYIMVCQL